MPALTLAVQEPDITPEVDYPRVALISLGHFTNDSYGSLMSSLIPYLVARGVISVSVAGFMILVYLLGSSVLQPFFGLMSDRGGRRAFAVIGPLVVGVTAGFFGLVGTLPMLLLLMAIGGLGTAAFHPQAASIVDTLSKNSKGWTMSIFSTGGNIGFAVGPLVAAAIATIGLHWDPIVIIPGVVVCGLMALYAPSPARHPQALDVGQLRTVFGRAWRSLSLIVSVIAIRSGAQYSMIIFLPLYFHAKGFPLQLGSEYAFTLSFAGALGGLVGGRLSDRLGRRSVAAVSLLLSAPLLALALLSTGYIIWLWVALGGACLVASNSITVVQGQELLPTNTGIASGLTMGFGFGLSGVISTILTNVSAHTSVSTAIWIVPMLPLAAAVLAWLVPETGMFRRRPAVTSATG